MVIKRTTFIKAIKNDEKSKKLLDVPVIKISILNRFIKLNQLLDIILK